MDTPKAVAESCELVLSMLPNNDAVRAVGLGKNGLAEATTGAKVWIDFSSIDQETIVSVSDALNPKGWTVVDVVHKASLEGDIVTLDGSASDDDRTLYTSGEAKILIRPPIVAGGERKS